MPSSTIPDFVSGRRDVLADLSFDHLRPSIKAVAFDLDGTLCDSIMQIVLCTRLSFEAMGLPQPEENAIKGMIGKRLQEGLTSLLAEDQKHLGEELTRIYRERFAEVDEIKETRLFPWVGDLLLHLKSRGLKIAYASGKSTRGIQRSLEESILGDYCDAMCAGDEVPSKPHPAMAVITARRLGLEPYQVLGVGDAGMDVQLFQNAHCASCGVQSGVWSGDALVKLQPNLLLPHAGHLRDFL
ncbi:MAG: HAD family hydrolase [Proteobacteria bacterium]|uniref:HAD family hydrolase n=1 Tax=Candidatus Avisuccinivibrio stercorigallinarum TaxID=2840704 RepID=A0A9D9GSR7_9GAMM|nr:HAD family hydrolase [Candidatus Avisuccinivibrio stercorigallinarum]